MHVFRVEAEIEHTEETIGNSHGDACENDVLGDLHAFKCS